MTRREREREPRIDVGPPGGPGRDDPLPPEPPHAHAGHADKAAVSDIARVWPEPGPPP